MLTHLCMCISHSGSRIFAICLLQMNCTEWRMHSISQLLKLPAHILIANLLQDTTQYLIIKYELQYTNTCFCKQTLFRTSQYYNFCSAADNPHTWIVVNSNSVQKVRRLTYLVTLDITSAIIKRMISITSCENSRWSVVSLTVQRMAKIQFYKMMAALFGWIWSVKSNKKAWI